MEPAIMSGSNVVPLRRKPRTADIVADAVAQGRKLPLQIMFESMWALSDEVTRLESSDDPDDQLVRRVARERLFRAACEVAPYVHPKQSATVVRGDAENPIRVRHEDRFARLTDEMASRFLEALNAGTMTIEDVDAQLR
jgi:hypothetical protein